MGQSSALPSKCLTYSPGEGSIQAEADRMDSSNVRMVFLTDLNLTISSDAHEHTADAASQEDFRSRDQQKSSALWATNTPSCHAQQLAKPRRTHT